MEYFALLLIAALIVGAAKGGLASAGALAVPFLSIWMDPLVAAGLLLPIFIISDLVAVWLYRRDFSKKNVILLAVSGVIGVGLATVMAPYVSVAMAQFATGAIGIFYCAQALRARLRKRVQAVPFDARSGLVWGILTGITSFISHTGAPPFQSFVLPQRLPKLVFAGTNTIVFAIINIAKLPAYASIGLMADFDWALVAWMSAVASVGAVLGRRLAQVLPDETYRAVIQILLFVLSLYLVVAALAHLF